MALMAPLDVVLAMSAGALRRYLLVAMVPVSMRADGAGQGNSVGMVLAGLGGIEIAVGSGVTTRRCVAASLPTN